MMKLYFGEDRFAKHKCLPFQEKHGWVSNHSGRRDAYPPFALGVEGTGHHSIISMFKWGEPDWEGHTKAHFSSVHGRIGAPSIPMGWRDPDDQRVVMRGSHPDVEEMVAQGRLIFVLLRYPPASFISVISRFAYCQRGLDHENASWVPPSPTQAEYVAKHLALNITMRHEVDVFMNSLTTMDSLLRFPDLDCGRVVYVPFELLTQHPLVLEAPIAEALQLDAQSLESKLLHRRLNKLRENAPQSLSTIRSIAGNCCKQLDLKPSPRRLSHFSVFDDVFSKQISDTFSRLCADRHDGVDIRALTRASAVGQAEPMNQMQRVHAAAHIVKFFDGLVGNADGIISRDEFALGAKVLALSSSPEDEEVWRLMETFGFPKRPASEVRDDAGSQPAHCGETLFRFARQHFDSHRYQYPSIYPAQSTISKAFSAEYRGSELRLAA